MPLESEFWTHLPAFLPTTEHGNKQSVAWDHQISWDWGKCLIMLPAFSSRDHPPMDLKQKNSLHNTCQTMKLLPQGMPGARGLHKTKLGGEKSTAGIKCTSSTQTIPGMPLPLPLMPLCTFTPAWARCKYFKRWMSLGTPSAEHWAAEHQPRLTNQSEMSRLSPSFLPWHPPECGFKLHKPQGVVVFVFSCRELFPSNALPDSCCD